MRLDIEFISHPGPFWSFYGPDGIQGHFLWPVVFVLRIWTKLSGSWSTTATFPLVIPFLAFMVTKISPTSIPIIYTFKNLSAPKSKPILTFNKRHFLWLSKCIFGSLFPSPYVTRTDTIKTFSLFFTPNWELKALGLALVVMIFFC